MKYLSNVAKATDQGAVVVIEIHNNELMRSYNFSINIDLPDYPETSVRPHTELGLKAFEKHREMFKELITMPQVCELYFSKNSIRIEVTPAWENRWGLFQEQILEIMERNLLQGREMEIFVKDQCDKYRPRPYDGMD